MMDASIVSELKHLKEGQHEVELMNFYQALPLTYRGVIVEVGEDEVTLIVQPPDSVCLTWDQQTYVLAPEPLDVLQADVADFDILSGQVRLCNLRYGGSRLGNRMITRVVPQTPLAVEIVEGGTRHPALLLDLSSQGAGIQLEVGGTGKAVGKGQRMKLTLHLPDGETTAEGKVQSVVLSGAGQHVSVVFDEESTDIRPVWRYISRRRMEILQELQEKYLSAYMDRAANQ